VTLADYTDANAWLDNTKLRFTDNDQAAPWAQNADQVVIAALSQVFPDHATLWDVNPGPGQEPTPSLVREIVGLLMASYYYEAKYSEITNHASSYSRHLEARANDLLDGLRTGLVVLTDVDYVSSTALAQGDFWPNDATLVTSDNPQVGLDEGDPDRRFTMDVVF
jgi:hypothetical protein